MQNTISQPNRDNRAPHVLIVDADPSAAHVTGAMAQRLAPGITVACELTPDRGWLSAQATPPDVLIIDPSPQKFGDLLLIQLYKEAYPDAGTIVVVSRPTPALRRRVHELGVDVYREKPTTLAQLGETLHGVLRKAEGRPPAVVSAGGPAVSTGM